MSLNDLVPYLGAPRGFSGSDVWREIESGTGPLPDDYKEFVAAYGPGAIGEFLYVFHPLEREQTMLDTIRDMAPLYQELSPGQIPYGVYPEALDGIIQWASTQEGDACFLVPATSTTAWRVGVWFRQWAQWDEFEMSVTTWLGRQLSGDLRVAGLPLADRGGFSPSD